MTTYAVYLVAHKVVHVEADSPEEAEELGLIRGGTPLTWRNVVAVDVEEAQ